jgi:hypothetical protein
MNRSNRRVWLPLLGLALIASGWAMAQDAPVPAGAPAAPQNAAPPNATPSGPLKPITAPFTVHVISSDIPTGYQLFAADIDKDGKTEIVALGLAADHLIWYRYPDFTPHPILTDLPTPQMVALDHTDTDGDGIPEILLAYGFNSNPTKSVGNVAILHSKDGNVNAPWTVQIIDKVPGTHRVRFVDVMGNGKKYAVAAPILSPPAEGFPDPGHDVTPLFAYRPGDWKPELVTNENHGVVHALSGHDWDGDGRQEIVTSGYTGVFAHSLGKDGTWKRQMLTAGDPAPWPNGGAGDFSMGKVRGKQFFVTIEPFHGTQVVVYTQDGKGGYARNVIESGLVGGHALLLSDIDGDGIPEIIAGGARMRDMYYFKATDASLKTWTRYLMDNNEASADCAVADIKGVGKAQDVVCIEQSKPSELKWYEYKGK